LGNSYFDRVKWRGFIFTLIKTVADAGAKSKSRGVDVEIVR